MKKLVISFVLLLLLPVIVLAENPAKNEKQDLYSRNYLRQEINSILSLREFIHHKTKTSILDEIIKKIKAFIQQHKPKIPKEISFFNKYIVYPFFVFLLITLIIYAYLNLKKHFAKSGKKDTGKKSTQRKNTLLSWEQLKEEALAHALGGDFRQGLRYIYLASLSFMTERELLNYDPTRTNAEYITMIKEKVSEDFLLNFKQFTFLFDEKWYGKRHCTKNDYDKAVALFQDLQQSL